MQDRKRGSFGLEVSAFGLGCMGMSAFARAVAFAISQPDDVDINEIVFRPTRQEL